MIGKDRSASPRARTLLFVAVLGLAAQSLEPMAQVERGLELAFSPARLLSRLGAPLRWAASARVRAAARSLAEEEEGLRELALELHFREQEAALPSDPGLRARRRFAHGEVQGRLPGARDSVSVRLASREGIAPGQPVVAGEHFVGRVVGPDPRDPRAVIVRLVTARDAFVGAALIEEVGAPRGAVACQLVVGGLAPAPPGASGVLHLAIHNPSRKAFGAGVAVVRELLAEPHGELADDFRLGELVLRRASARGYEPEALRAGVDFEGGLFHVLVVKPPEPGRSEELLELETFLPEAWVPARPLGRGDASPLRDALRVSLPRGHRVGSGAALEHAGHLLGRIDTVDPLGADVRCLGDRGLRLAVLAEVEGETAPRALGSLLSLGRAEGRTLLFLWQARVPLAPSGESERKARLFTGSGERGVPRGLAIGRTRLPSGPGPHLLRVEPDPRLFRLDRGRVWVGLAAGGGRS